MHDLRFAFRQLLKNPGFTAVAVLTLALGIGANTALFNVVNAVLLRPLPYPEADRLVTVCENNPRLGLDQYVTSMGAYFDWREQSSVFQELAGATVLGPTPILGEASPELVQAGSVSANFFPLLGIQPLLGRPFLSEEEKPDRGDVVLLSESLWRTRFGASPGILNQSIRLGERSFTVVGVMPSRLKLFDPAGVQGWEDGFSKCDLWRPLPVQSGLRKQRNYRAFLVLGRLKPGISLAQAQAEMTNIAREQARQYPDSNAGWGITVQSWHQTVMRNARRPLVLLCGAVGFVLLIATANLANLCLARAGSRQKELAIRIALGAGRFQIARHFLVESLLLSGLGAAAGLLLAEWSTRLMIGLLPASLPRAEEIGLDGRVLGFAFALSVVVGLLFGLAPLLTCWRSDVNEALKREARGSSTGAEGHRLRASLVVSQVALVMILLSGAGLLTRSFWRLSEVDPGFQPKHLLALDVSIQGGRYTNRVIKIQAVQEVLNRLSQLAGGDSFAAVDGLPLDAGRASMDIALTSIDGSPPATPDGKLLAGLRLVSPGYFRTMAIPLSRGRFFSERDNTNAPPVVIINEALARQYFAGSDPIGQRIGSPDFGPVPCEIVGIVKNVKHSALDSAPRPEAFRPLLQDCFSSLTLVARSGLPPASTFAAMKEIVSGLNRNWPVHSARTLNHLLAASLAPRRFALLLMGWFAGLALVLAVVGIYGVLSCVVNERTREIGIRLALGAPRRHVLGLVLKRGMQPVLIGVLAGLAGAAGLTRVLGRWLYEVTPTDPWTFLTVTLLLTATAMGACLLPARRATKTDPIQALRNE
jgi:putative ABC transport system permease protein